jgi:hypothetical protein
LSEDIKYEEDLGAYFKRFRKLLCIAEIKMEQSKILRLEFLSVLIHSSPNIDPPYTKHPISFPIPLPN